MTDTKYMASAVGEGDKAFCNQMYCSLRYTVIHILYVTHAWRTRTEHLENFSARARLVTCVRHKHSRDDYMNLTCGKQDWTIALILSIYICVCKYKYYTTEKTSTYSCLFAGASYQINLSGIMPYSKLFIVPFCAQGSLVWLTAHYYKSHPVVYVINTRVNGSLCWCIFSCHVLIYFIESQK
jgi:hypothetical protein